MRGRCDPRYKTPLAGARVHRCQPIRPIPERCPTLGASLGYSLPNATDRQLQPLAATAFCNGSFISLVEKR